MAYGKNGARATMRRLIRSANRPDGKRGITKPTIKKNRDKKKAERQARKVQRRA